MSSIKIDGTKTGDEFRAMATERYQRSAESFERCDTDGFLSQWAADCQGSLYQTCARVADSLGTDGLIEFSRLVLTDLDGQPIADARLISTKFGLKWRSDELDVWLPYQPARVSTLANKGFAEAELSERAPVRVGLRGANATSVHPCIFRADLSDTEYKMQGWSPILKSDAQLAA